MREEIALMRAEQEAFFQFTLRVLLTTALPHMSDEEILDKIDRATQEIKSGVRNG